MDTCHTHPKFLDHFHRDGQKNCCRSKTVQLIEYPTNATSVEVFWLDILPQQMLRRFAHEKLTKQIQWCTQKAQTVENQCLDNMSCTYLLLRMFPDHFVDALYHANIINNSGNDP